MIDLDKEINRINTVSTNQLNKEKSRFAKEITKYSVEDIVVEDKEVEKPIKKSIIKKLFRFL